LNILVATQRVLGGNDDARAPDDPARRAARLGVNGNRACRGAIRGEREGIGQSNEFS